MKNIKSFQNHSHRELVKDKLFTVEDMRKAFEAGRLDKRNNWYGGDFNKFIQKYSHTRTDNLHGKNPTNWIEFGGRKFYTQDLLYAQYDDMGEIPRIEGDKLIIANPSWSE